MYTDQAEWEKVAMEFRTEKQGRSLADLIVSVNKENQ